MNVSLCSSCARVDILCCCLSSASSFGSYRQRSAVFVHCSTNTQLHCSAELKMEWSREHTIRLIRSLKRQDVLWNTSSKNYRDRRKKAIAWNTIETEVGVPVDICKRRVESLLASCRRERNKIRRSAAVDEPELVYEPKWTFWKEFGFLRGIPDSPEEEGDPLGLNLPDSPIAQWSPSARRPPRKRRKTGDSNTQSQTSLLLKPDDASVWSSNSNAITKQTWEGDEFDAFGITVAAKLRKMQDSQRIFAENIINQALYKGLLFQLNSHSEEEFLPQARIQQSQQTTQETTTHWQTHAFTTPSTSYVTKASHPVVVEAHQTTRESAEDFKQINMM